MANVVWEPGNLNLNTLRSLLDNRGWTNEEKLEVIDLELDECRDNIDTVRSGVCQCSYSLIPGHAYKLAELGEKHKFLVDEYLKIFKEKR